jgi:hydrogenase small subunit
MRLSHHIEGAGPLHLDRRNFLRACTLAAAAVGLPAAAGRAFASAALRGAKPSVIWLHFSECTGCTESLLRTAHPPLDDLILDLISLDYHETLFAAAGARAEAAKQAAMQEHAGRYILVVEGAVPTAAGGIYCRIGGRTALEVVHDAAAHAGVIIAIGSCASWGGVASADPNPTGAAGLPAILPDRPIVTIPGCPPNAYNLLGVMLQFATFGTLPALDAQGRPKFAYARTIHEHCPRRPHFDAGRFVKKFGDRAHREGWCLYELGCKGPQTFASCSTQMFADVPDGWPIGIGHPCIGCTEPSLAFRVPLHATITIPDRTPSVAHAPIAADHRTRISPVATALVGLTGGILIGGGLRVADHLRRAAPDPEEEV